MKNALSSVVVWDWETLQDGTDAGALLPAEFTVAVVHEWRRQHRRTLLPDNVHHTNLPKGRSYQKTVNFSSGFISRK